MSLSLRLTLSYLLVAILGIGIVAPLAWLAVEQVYLDTQKANLLAQAQVVAATLQTASPQLAGTDNFPPYAQTTNALPGIHTWVIEEKNAVVLDLPASQNPDQPYMLWPDLAQNTTGRISPQALMSRPEIALALAGQPATAIRQVTTGTKRRVLYAAAPVRGTDGQISRIVYLTSPLPDPGWGALPLATRWQLAGAGLLAVLLAGGAGWWLAQSLARPLQKLTGVAHAVAAGDLNQSVSETSSITDLRTLGHAFNAMTASLRQADQAKVAFVADVSHELRTPLTVIKGTVETLQDGAIDDLSARDAFLESMASETERLIRLVNDLLLLTRADAGALNLQLQPVDLGRLARARVKHLAGIAARNKVQLQVVETAAPDPAAPQLMADPLRLSQVFDNLLENAIRYSQPGATVTLTLSCTPAAWRCAVADTGPGIATQHLPLIFDRFYRADASRSRRSGGSGLGLAITRSLILAHGGHIAVESREGEGTTFTFDLPLAPNCP
jgi:two-component system, OmpR family, sensor histidine kinase BaeS